MEYALWGQGDEHEGRADWVLILILMEYALWDCRPLDWKRPLVPVLILILMEYALWAMMVLIILMQFQSLNPYSNGICSMSDIPDHSRKRMWPVLILILMEYALWAWSSLWCNQMWKRLNPYSNGICSMRKTIQALWARLRTWVLILILMEYALWGVKSAVKDYSKASLNPYSNGICSMRHLVLVVKPWILMS